MEAAFVSPLFRWGVVRFPNLRGGPTTLRELPLDADCFSGPDFVVDWLVLEVSPVEAVLLIERRGGKGGGTFEDDADDGRRAEFCVLAPLWFPFNFPEVTAAAAAFASSCCLILLTAAGSLDFSSVLVFACSAAAFSAASRRLIDMRRRRASSAVSVVFDSAEEVDCDFCGAGATAWRSNSAPDCTAESSTVFLKSLRFRRSI